MASNRPLLCVQGRVVPGKCSMPVEGALKRSERPSPKGDRDRRRVTHRWFVLKVLLNGTHGVNREFHPFSDDSIKLSFAGG